MELAQLDNLVKQGESQKIEFKTSTAQLHSAIETVCAFLNGHGGTVFIGIKDSGQLVGQDVTDQTRREIAKELNKIEPSAQAHIDVKYVPYKWNKKIIVIEVNVADHAPYTYDGRAHQRTQSSTSRMSQHRYEQLLVKRGSLNHSWDEQIAMNCDINSLDHVEIRNTIQDGIKKNRIAIEMQDANIEEMLQYLKLINNGKLLNSAVVLYAKDVEPYHAQCLIRMTRYRGINKLGNFLDSKHVYGNAFEILQEANYFTMRHLPVASFFGSDKFERIDKPALPIMAIREALINAISHRDYTNHSASISFAIFEDRLEIWNNGPLPPELKISDLKKRHESYPRNKRITKLFYTRGWVEKAGIGTLRMIDECAALGVPSPKFEEYSGGFAVIFKFKEPIGIDIVSSQIKLTERQFEILNLLKKNEYNSKEISSKLKSAPNIRVIQKELVKLEKAGFVGRIGKARSFRWKLLKSN